MFPNRWFQILIADFKPIKIWFKTGLPFEVCSVSVENWFLKFSIFLFISKSDTCNEKTEI